MSTYRYYAQIKADEASNSNLPSYWGKYDSNDERIIDELLKSYRSGYIFVSFTIGTLYHDGVGGANKNTKKAIEWYLISFSENKNIDGGLEAAVLLSVDEKYEQAYEIYKKLEEIENHIALCALGMFYQYGFYVQKNMKKAQEYYLRSIKQGNLAAPVYLMKIYLRKGKLIKVMRLYFKTFRKRWIEFGKDEHSDFFRNM